MTRRLLYFEYQPVSAAWTNPERQCRHLYGTPPALASFQPVLDRAKDMGLKRPATVVTDRDAIERMLPPGAVHQGLALDSVDALQLAVMLEKRFQLKLSNAEEARRVMQTVTTIAHAVAANDSLRKRGLERHKLLDQEWAIARFRGELEFVQNLADDLESGRLTWTGKTGVTSCHPPDQHDHRTDYHARRNDEGAP